MQADAKRPTLRDVAERAGVSKTTASYVLNNVSSQKISAVTQARVRIAATELGFTPNPAAKSLAARESTTVVCTVSTAQMTESILELISVLTLRFARHGLSLAMHVTPDGGTESDGVALLEPRVAFPLIPDLVALNAVLAQTHEVGSAGVIAALLDAGCRTQVEYLVARGHRRLGFAGSARPPLVPQSRWRHDCVTQVSRDLGLADPIALTIGLDTDLTPWLEGGVTAVCAQNDVEALGTIALLRRAGLRCPEDIAVIGYDGASFAELSDPPLTTVTWEYERVAEVVVNRTLGLLTDDDLATGDGEGDYIVTRVVARASA